MRAIVNKQFGLRLAIVTAIGVLAVGGFVWLFEHSADIDAAQHQRIVTLTEQVKQLDAAWSTDVLRSATDLSKDYDALVTPLTQWPVLRASLKENVATLHSAPIAAAISRLDSLFEQKAQLVNRFKALNATLKNSLRYLPTAHAEISKVVSEGSAGTSGVGRSSAQASARVDATLRKLSFVSPGDGAAAIALAREALTDVRTNLQSATRESSLASNALSMSNTDAALGAVVATALSYNLTPDDNVGNVLRQQNEALKADVDLMAPALRGGVRTLISHVDMVLKQRSAVSTLLEGVNTVPISGAVGTLLAAVNDGFALHVAQQATYSRWLQVYVVAILLCLLAAAVMLIRLWSRMSGDLRTSKAQLDSAQLRLVEADRLSTAGKMSASLAHEINTPLGTLRSAIAMCKEMYESHIVPAVDAIGELPSGGDARQAVASSRAKEFNAEVRGDFELCFADGLLAADHIRDVIASLRDFTQIDKGKVAVVSMEKQVRTTLKMLGSEIAGRGIEVVTQFDPNTPEVECNSAAINQVLLNVIRNGAEAMPQGGKIAVQVKPHGGDSVIVKIADTGSGMEPAVLARIFEQNFTTKRDGTGIGLSISKSIVDRHGGELRVKSTVGEGTIFALVLPTKVASGAAESGLSGMQLGGAHG